jgi:hypothetical protein
LNGYSSISACIPDRLDLLGLMGSQQPTHGHTESADQIGSLLVPMGLGQGGEPERSANKKVCATAADRCAIAYLTRVIIPKAT